MAKAPNTLREFQQHLARLPYGRCHLVADLALRGYLAELEGQANAALALARLDTPHRAAPNSRAAFEASQQCMLLASSDNYNRDGARAWVYDLMRDQALGNRAPNGDLGGITSDERFTHALAEMRETAEMFCPGQGRWLDEAHAFLLPRRNKRPDNWLGEPVAPVLAKRLHAMAEKTGHTLPVSDPSQTTNDNYAFLSRNGHPRPSLRPVRIESLSPGSITVEFEGVDLTEQADLLDIQIAASLNMGTSAMLKRMQMQTQPPREPST